MLISRDPFISVDTETTGVDTQEARIIELGIVAFAEGRCIPEQVRAHRFHPGVPIPSGASDIHQIYDQDVAQRPPLRAYPQLRPLMRSSRLVGYNLIGYDGPVLAAECARHLGEPLPAPGGLDALVFVRWHLRHLSPVTLERICIHFGIDLIAAHSAAADAKAAGEVLLRLVELGLVPDEREAALELQARLVQHIAEERLKWTYHLYVDRQDGRTLRIGYGKHCGRALEQVPRDYLQYALDQHARAVQGTSSSAGSGRDQERPLPPAVLSEYQRLVAPRRHAQPAAAPARGALP